MIKKYEIKTNSIEVLFLHDATNEIVTITNKSVFYFKAKRISITANIVTITDVKEVFYNEVSYYLIRIITKDNKCITVSRYGDIKL